MIPFARLRVFRAWCNQMAIRLVLLRKSMNKIAFVVLSCFAIIACKKEGSSSYQGEITGRWELRLTSGSVGGNKTFNPGNGDIREFSEDSSFRFIIPGLPDVTGTYTLSKVTSTDWRLTLNYSSSTQPRSVTDTIRFETNNRLAFFPEQTCCDIPTYTYESLSH